MWSSWSNGTSERWRVVAGRRAAGGWICDERWGSLDPIAHGAQPWEPGSSGPARLSLISRPVASPAPRSFSPRCVPLPHPDRREEGIRPSFNTTEFKKLPSTLKSHRWRNTKKRKSKNLWGPAQVLFWDGSLLHQLVSCFFSRPAELGRRDWPSGNKPHEPGSGAPLGPSRQQQGQARYLLDQ